MEELKINGKAIYTTKGAAREYGRVGCNFYTGRPAPSCAAAMLRTSTTAVPCHGMSGATTRSGTGDILQTCCATMKRSKEVSWQQ